MTDARRRRTLAKLGEVCRDLERVLAGQDARLQDVDLPGEGEPGETPRERLERFKARLSETLAELARGDPRRCRTCAEPLPDPVLDEVPWTTTCRSCAAA